MKAVVAHGRDDLRIDDLIEPEVSDGGVIVDIAYGGICGSDLHYLTLGRNGSFVIREPLVLGHEVVGRISAIHPDVEGFSVGTPVAIHPAWPAPPAGSADGVGLNVFSGGTYLGSASTWPHTQGGFAEKIRVEPNQLRPIPAGLPLRRAALAEPLSIALHAVDRVAGRVAGARVLVAGAGPIGCLVVAALRQRGAATITATDLYRRPLGVAQSVGADHVIELGVDSAPEPQSFDLVIEASGAVASLVSALDLVRPKGAIVQLGILPSGPLPIPLAEFLNREISLHGSQRFDIEMDEALEMLNASDAFDAVVTDVFDVSDAAEAFSRAADSQASTKTLLKF